MVRGVGDGLDPVTGGELQGLGLGSVERVGHLDARQVGTDLDGGVRGPVLLRAVVQLLVVDPVPGAGDRRCGADLQGPLDGGPGRLVGDRSAEFRRDGLSDAVGARLRAEGDLQQLLGRGGVEGERTDAWGAVAVLRGDPDGVSGAGRERGGGTPALPVGGELSREVTAAGVHGADVGDAPVVTLDGDFQGLVGVGLLLLGGAVEGDLVARVVRLRGERVAVGRATGGRTRGEGHDQQGAAHYGADARRVVHAVHAKKIHPFQRVQ